MTLCECGCGHPTKLAMRNRAERGQVKGKPLRFISGHNATGVGRKLSEETKRLIAARATGRRHSAETRAKMSQAGRGERNHNWKGDAVRYVTLHGWLLRNYEKTGACEHCGSIASSRTEWANVSGEYRRSREDFIELCPRCHKSFDRSRR